MRGCSGGSSASGTTINGEGSRFERDLSGESSYNYAPAAEQNLSRRVKTATAIHREDPIMLALDDPRIPTGTRCRFDRPAEVAGQSALDTLLKRRAVLERQLEEVKVRQSSMASDKYEAKVERLLVEIARISRQARTKSR